MATHLLLALAPLRGAETDETPDPAVLLSKYTPRPSANQAAPTALQALQHLHELHETSESVRTKQQVTDAVLKVSGDKDRMESTTIRRGQDHLQKRAETRADARDVEAAMDALATSTGPVDDEALKALEELENLSRRIEDHCDRMTREAVTITQQLTDPLAVLNNLHSKFPTLRKRYF